MGAEIVIYFSAFFVDIGDLYESIFIANVLISGMRVKYGGL